MYIARRLGRGPSVVVLCTSGMGAKKGTGLSDLERASLKKELLSRVEQQAEQLSPGWVDDGVLTRYLRARSWNVDKAEKMLLKSLEWRHRVKPGEIRWNEIEEDCKSGKMYMLKMRDREGRPIILMRPAREQHHGEHDRNIKYLTYLMENTVKSMDPDTDGKLLILIDFQGWTLRNSPPIKTSKETLSILQNQYPERLHKAVLYSPPSIFGVFFNIMRPFVDPVTREKISFIYKKHKSEKMLEDMFDLDKLESAVGGRNSQGYDHSEFGELMRAAEKIDTAEEVFLDARGTFPASSEDVC